MFFTGLFLIWCVDRGSDITGSFFSGRRKAFENSKALLFPHVGGMLASPILTHLQNLPFRVPSSLLTYTYCFLHSQKLAYILQLLWNIQYLAPSAWSSLVLKFRKQKLSSLTIRLYFLVFLFPAGLAQKWFISHSYHNIHRSNWSPWWFFLRWGLGDSGSFHVQTLLP